MKAKQTRKVSFRVAPSVNEGLELLAKCNETTLAGFIRACVNYALTADGDLSAKLFQGWTRLSCGG